MKFLNGAVICSSCQSTECSYIHGRKLISRWPAKLTMYDLTIYLTILKCKNYIILHRGFVKTFQERNLCPGLTMASIKGLPQHNNIVGKCSLRNPFWYICKCKQQPLLLLLVFYPLFVSYTFTAEIILSCQQKLMGP